MRYSAGEWGNPGALASTADDAWLVSQYIQQLSDGIAGYDLFDGIKNGTSSWNDDAMIQAAELFQEEVNKGYFEDGFTGVSGSEAEALFQTGQTAMYFNGSWEISNLDNSEVCEEAENISCFVMPAVNAETFCANKPAICKWAYGMTAGTCGGGKAPSQFCKT